MKFLLEELSRMGYNKPFVQVDDTDDWIQWDSCDLEGLPTKRIGKTVNDMGKIPKGQWDNLPEKFIATNGKEYNIKDIHSLKTFKYSTIK
jgi:hypothetical protein